MCEYSSVIFENANAYIYSVLSLLQSATLFITLLPHQRKKKVLSVNEKVYTPDVSLFYNQYLTCMSSDHFLSFFCRTDIRPMLFISNTLLGWKSIVIYLDKDLFKIDIYSCK